MKKTNKGITLTTLVITIIILLILSGVTIAGISGNKGIIEQTEKAQLIIRARDVEEKIEIWKVKNENKDVSVSESTLEGELLEELKKEELVFEDEINQENKIITIGTKEIYYGLD